MQKVIDCEVYKEYKTEYPLQPPNLQRRKFDDELLQLEEKDGLTEFCFHKMETIEYGEPPTSNENFNGTNKYLWVVMEERVPIILENGTAGQNLGRKSVSHTNLTGGRDAYCGGEVWFDSESNTIWVSGGSSRYRARGKQELDKIVDWFSRCNYIVINFGWDEEVNAPVRLLRRKSG